MLTVLGECKKGVDESIFEQNVKNNYALAFKITNIAIYVLLTKECLLC